MKKLFDKCIPLLEEQPSLQPSPIPLQVTNSLVLGVPDYMPSVRNDAYVTVKLDQMISRANRANIKLPPNFYVLVCLLFYYHHYHFYVFFFPYKKNCYESNGRLKLK